MGKSESKHTKVETEEPFKLNPGLQGVATEIKDIFDKNYAEMFEKEPLYAGNPAALYPEQGIYIKQDRDAPLVLVVASKGDRASDMAMNAAGAYAAKMLPKRHIALIKDPKSVKTSNKIMSEVYYWL
jgi:hypothetical protein